MTAPKFRSVESLITNISQLALQEERETIVKVRHKR